jgi:hypothetical protein
MTRSELIRLVIEHATRNGFDFDRWYGRALGVPAGSEPTPQETLATGRRYLILLFSHEFARAFWKQGSRITFVVPTSSYTRRNKDGKEIRVERKAYTRRTLKPDAWKYHLREMAVSDEPLRYIRRFVTMDTAGDTAVPAKSTGKGVGSARSARNAASARARSRYPARSA